MLLKIRNREGRVVADLARAFVPAALAACILACPFSRTANARHVSNTSGFPAKDFAKLDTFEGLNLEEADKLYGKGDFRGAYAAYKAYSFEFAKSRALPYVLLRMGRCLHNVDKRHAAIKAYQDVVDYFPDDVRYAAAALYYIGVCHGENGDAAKQTAVWARMVKDDDYVQEPNSGRALTHLGRAMEKLGRFEEAAEYHWRTAVAFRKSNWEAARDACGSVIHHYVIRAPNHDKLKKFYTEAGGFDGRGYKVNNPEKDRRYWATVLDTVLRTGAKAEIKKTAAEYWTSRLGSQFVDDDGFSIARFRALEIFEKDRNAYRQRVLEQYKRKPATLSRVLQFASYYSDHKTRVAFFMEHGGPMVGSLKTNEKISLLNRLRDLRMNDEVRSLIPSVRTQGMTDQEIRNWAFFVANYEGEDIVLNYFSKMKDDLSATRARFDYFNGRSHRNKDAAEKALAEIPALLKSPKHANEVIWAKASLLHGLGRYEEAIRAYQQANRQPDSTWKITDCLIAMKNYGKAIDTVRQLESVGGGVAAQAALKVADIYRIGGNKAKEVQQLRTILRRYPKSGQSSAAHQRLEKYGVRLIGGESEAEE
jgi:tetratricopeptide (TPR) repeat protein